MKRRILSTLLALLLCAGLATAAQAADDSYNIKDGDINIRENGEYTITGETTAYTITVADGVTAKITLENVKIDVSAFATICAFDIGDGAKVTLVLVGTNTLKSGNSSNGAPGIHLPASATLTIESSTGGSLEVTGGDGSSYGGVGIGGNSGDGCGTLTINSGNVTVEGGSAQTEDGNAFGGAGIGGGAGNPSGGTGGNVTVNGGTLSATGGNGTSESNGYAYGGAGIGGGAGSIGGSGGSVAVNGGKVTAKGGDGTSQSTGNAYGGAGIGGGAGGSKGGSGGSVTVTGGEVTATGGDGDSNSLSAYGGAGIGGGAGMTGGAGGSVTVTGGKVTAKGGNGTSHSNGNAYGGAGIGGAGGSNGGSGGSVTVNDGEVTATGGDGNSSIGSTYGGAGIGGGAGSSKGGDGSTVVIKLTNTVTATGGNKSGANTGKDIGGGRGAIDAASDGQGILPVTNTEEDYTHEVYGNLTLNENVTIPKNINVVIPDGAILTVDAGVTLAVNGTLTLTDGKLTNNGTINGSGNLTGTVFPEDSAGKGIRTLFNNGTISVDNNDFATKVVWTLPTQTVGYGQSFHLNSVKVTYSAGSSGESTNLVVGDVKILKGDEEDEEIEDVRIENATLNENLTPPLFILSGADWAPAGDNVTRTFQLIAEFTPDNTNNLLGSITNGKSGQDDSPFRLTIRLRKPQNVALTASESPGKAKATWTPYDGVNQFSLQLYKGSSSVTDVITLGMRVYEYEFDITEAGTYTFKVWGSSLVEDEYTMVGSNELTFHAVTLMNGQETIDTYYVASGNTLTLPTEIDNLPDGSALESWTLSGGSETSAPGEVVTVNGDMTFTANLSTPSGGGDTPATPPVEIPDTYPIEIVGAANGEVSTSLTNASRGSVITITATPDAGYSVGSVSVTGPDGRVDVKRVNATTYTFVMPEGEVTVRVTFTTGLPFTDVSANQWFYEAVSYVYANGMMEGDSATTFNPDGQMTRAMFWAVLGRIDGAEITGSNWAAEAREWAMSEGVSDGTDTNGLVTREMMVTMLWRYAGEPESDYSLSAYTDASSVSDWAETAMAWAVENGVISGVTANTLAPQGTATRAQCAAIFMRYDQM